jgi:hypothetical protein
MDGGSRYNARSNKTWGDTFCPLSLSHQNSLHRINFYLLYTKGKQISKVKQNKALGVLLIRAPESSITWRVDKDLFEFKESEESEGKSSREDCRVDVWLGILSKMKYLCASLFLQVLSPGVAYIVCVCVCVCECDLVHIFL